MRRVVRDVTPQEGEVTCGGCGQQDGPFKGQRAAAVVLEFLGWHKVPPPEAWTGTYWEGGHGQTWYCPNCFPAWQRAARAYRERLGVA